MTVGIDGREEKGKRGGLSNPLTPFDGQVTGRQGM